MTRVLLLGVCLSICALMPAQSIIIGTGSAQNGWNTYPAPYGNWYWGARHQMIVPATELTAAGMPVGNVIGVGFDVAAAQGVALQGFTMSMGLVPPGSILTTWVPGLTPVYGPQNYIETTGWNIHALAAPFAWDGVSDVVIETCFNNAAYTANATINQSATTYTSTLLYRQDAAGVCGNSALTASYQQRPNLQFVMQAGAPEWQQNSPAATFDLDGTLATSLNPAVTPKCVGSPGILNYASTQVGLPYDTAVVLSGSLVAASAGGFQTPGGQAVNVNMAAPSLSWLNGGAALTLMTPYPANYGLPFSTPPILNSASAQSVWVDPTHADGLAVSQGAQLDAVQGGSVVCATADEAITTVVFGDQPLCAPASFNFYGTPYTQMHVMSNGFIRFDAPNQSWLATPATAASYAMVGYWTDLHPGWTNGGAGPGPGTVTVSNLGGGVVRIDWVNCPYYCTPATVTFGIELDFATDGITIDGLSGIQTNPGTCGSVGADSALLGISCGPILGATDPGGTNFDPAAGGSGIPLNVTDMMYEWYDSNTMPLPAIVPSLATGNLNTIIFMAAANTYSWGSY